MKFVLGGLAVMFLGLCMTAAAQVPQNLVRAELVNDYRPGAASFLVGVHLQIEPEWHIYWKYPGDAGLATSVKWTLPEGFTVSELMWPVPVRFQQEGDVEGIGYEEEVVLLARVTPPPGWSSPVTIGADVRWLACEATCVPGKAAVQTQVDPAAATEASQAELIARWLPQVPVPAESRENPAKVRVITNGMEYRIELSGITAEHVQCIVAPGEGLSVVTNKVEGRTVQLVLHAMDGAKPSNEPSEAVVAWTEGGKPRGVSIRLSRP